MKIIMVLAAKNDFLDTIQYYKVQRENLGFEFASEVKKINFTYKYVS